MLVVRRFWVGLLALLAVACIGAQPWGGPVGIRSPAEATPTAPFPLDATSDAARVPSLSGAPSGVPTPAETDYRDDVDVRELYGNLAAYADQPLRYRGTVWTVIEENELLFVQIRVPYGASADEWRAIVVLFPTYRIAVDRAALREGVTVIVWGRPRTMLRFTDVNSQEEEQPLLLGDRIEVVR
mgnify:CR=1 FL=1